MKASRNNDIKVTQATMTTDCHTDDELSNMTTCCHNDGELGSMIALCYNDFELGRYDNTMF